jgi:hypothetical protein
VELCTSLYHSHASTLLLLASELFQVYRAVWYTVATRPRSYAGRPVQQQQQQKKELQQTLFARRRAAAGSRQHVSFHLRLLLLDVIQALWPQDKLGFAKSFAPHRLILPLAAEATC